MNERRWTLAEVNDFDCAEFIRVIGPVFEHSPWIAEAAWARRPFGSLDELHRTLGEVVPEPAQTGRTHPCPS
jgi:2-oxo-4-hydroxy-4-carboxy-5-ureidoimidazoline decarboxylase